MVRMSAEMSVLIRSKTCAAPAADIAARMMLRMCCAQSPVYTQTAAACSAAPIALHTSSGMACCAAASTTAASRRLVAREALHVSLITSDPASRSSASTLDCGPVHAAEAPAAVSNLNLSSQRAGSFLPRAKALSRRRLPLAPPCRPR
eukprot:3975956-Pleurochrysis_carterae.AAC.1